HFVKSSAKDCSNCLLQKRRRRSLSQRCSPCRSQSKQSVDPTDHWLALLSQMSCPGNSVALIGPRSLQWLWICQRSLCQSLSVFLGGQTKRCSKVVSFDETVPRSQSPARISITLFPRPERRLRKTHQA